MSVTNIPIQSVPANGGKLTPLVLTPADQGNGMSFVDNGRTMLLFVNNGASPVTWTIASVADEYGRTGDVTVSVPAAAGGIQGLASWGPCRKGTLFRQATGVINANPSTSTTNWVAALSLEGSVV